MSWGCSYEDGGRDEERETVDADGVGVSAWVEYLVEGDALEDCG